MGIRINDEMFDLVEATGPICTLCCSICGGGPIYSDPDDDKDD
jgi:hypothetical protein